MTFYKTIYSLTLLAMVFSLGCNEGEKPNGMPILFPCTVHVTMNGQPQTDALVHFNPENNGQWYASGITDNSGNVKMLTLSKFRGVAEGNYKVTIVKTIDDPAWKPTKNMDGVLETEPTWTSIYDIKFASPETTTLTCSIKPGKNPLEFNVTENMKLKNTR